MNKNHAPFWLLPICCWHHDNSCTWEHDVELDRNQKKKQVLFSTVYVPKCISFWLSQILKPRFQINFSELHHKKLCDKNLFVLMSHKGPQW